MVGAYEAKTHLPELLEKAEAGEEFTITRHGSPIAKLVPLKKKATVGWRQRWCRPGGSSRLPAFRRWPSAKGVCRPRSPKLLSPTSGSWKSKWMTKRPLAPFHICSAYAGHKALPATTPCISTWQFGASCRWRRSTAICARRQRSWRPTVGQVRQLPSRGQIKDSSPRPPTPSSLRPAVPISA